MKAIYSTTSNQTIKCIDRDIKTLESQIERGEVVDCIADMIGIPTERTIADTIADLEKLKARRAQLINA